MKRQWIIGPQQRVCPKIQCEGNDVPGDKKHFRVTAEGVVHGQCRFCQRKIEEQATDFWDKRPCDRCHFVRRVRVHIWNGGEEQWTRRCRACECEISASNHEVAMNKFRAEARRIRHRQAQVRLG